MQKREIHKDFDLGGRKWRINKFDAMTGSYVAYKVMTQILPMLLNAQAETEEGRFQAITSGLMASRSTMSKEDFISLQRDCLGICFELQDAGGTLAPVAVLMADGRWGIPDLEHDTMTVLALTVHALMFNVSSFFDGDALKGMAGSFQGFSLFNAKE